MTDLLDYLLKHSYAVLFFVVLVDHLGMPLPATPFLLAAGAVAHAEGASLTIALLVVLLASLAAHSVWYEAGRRGGRRILKLVCRIALEPDACVRRTENTFGRYGVKALLIAPFVPGLGTVARPMAAMMGVSFLQFIVFAVAGAAIWAASFLVLGYALGRAGAARAVSRGFRRAAGRQAAQPAPAVGAPGAARRDPRNARPLLCDLAGAGAAHQRGGRAAGPCEDRVVADSSA